MQDDAPLRDVSFAVRIEPDDARVGTPTNLIATLTNSGRAPVVVNARMLLNNAAGPGEVWLAVEGPPGYRNMRGIRVNAGKPANDLFRRLAPGESAQQSWELTRYQSLDAPGDYVVTLTYHNEIGDAPDGRRVLIGRISASARLHRRA